MEQKAVADSNALPFELAAFFPTYEAATFFAAADGAFRFPSFHGCVAFSNLVCARLTVCSALVTARSARLTAGVEFLC